MSLPAVPPVHSLPAVLANFAITLDGKVSTRSRTPSLFTSPRDKQRLLEIRALGDALLVGRGTVEADTMSMGLPDAALRAERIARGQAEYPLRVVISREGKFRPSWKIFHSPGGRVLLFSAPGMDPALREQLSCLPGVELILMEDLSVAGVLRVLAESHRVQTVVCEGGPTLLRSLLEIDALEELYLTIAPRVFGGIDAPTLTGTHGDYFRPPVNFSLVDFSLEDGEVYTHYRRHRS